MPISLYKKNVEYDDFKNNNEENMKITAQCEHIFHLITKLIIGYSQFSDGQEEKVSEQQAPTRISLVHLFLEDVPE